MDRDTFLYGPMHIVVGIVGGVIGIAIGSKLGLNEAIQSFSGIAGYAVGALLWLWVLNSWVYGRDA
jgi:uncharacterized membrane protein YeaQ/YmgE (transglycosylase-associated protein family)